MSRKEKVVHVGVAKKVNYKPIPENAMLMTLEEFEDLINVGAFTSDDGHGYYVRNGEMSDVDVWNTVNLSDFTHVAWFNK